MKTAFLRGRDIRTPADPQDKQTTDVRAALPPQEFIAQKVAGVNTLSITDRQGPQDRVSTVSYRIYFIPNSLLPVSAATTATQRLAGQNMGTLVAEVAAPARGTVLTIQDTINTNSKGRYSCVAVNRMGTEAPPQNVVVAP